MHSTNEQKECSGIRLLKSDVSIYMCVERERNDVDSFPRSPVCSLGKQDFFPLSGMVISVEMHYTTLLKDANVLQHFKKCR